jgi:hypothetical protein
VWVTIPPVTASPKGLRLVVDVTPQAATLRSGRSGQRVDTHACHRGEIDDQTAVAQGVSGHGVPATAHRHRQRPLSGEPHRR